MSSTARRVRAVLSWFQRCDRRREWSRFSAMFMISVEWQDEAKTRARFSLPGREEWRTEHLDALMQVLAQIGANGSGKTSLFALLRGELHTDKGEVEFPTHWRIAHVAQETPALERPATDYAIDGDTALRSLETELASAEAAGDGALMGELHAALADADVYTVRSRAETLLLGLGFGAEQLYRPVASFSGGWRMRLNLAQALMCRSDLLLLDEPTNHLDLDAVLWLEDWLQKYPGTLLLITHDRDFLDATVGAIVHFDAKKLRVYPGNYAQFVIQRAEGLVLAQAQYEKQQRERDHLQSFIDRF